MAIGIATIVAGIGSAIQNVASGAIKVLAIVASITFATAFALAIINLMGLVSEFVATSVIGEVFAIVSMCLPFHPSTIFASIVILFSGILVFLVAKKTWELVSNLIGLAT